MLITLLCIEPSPIHRRMRLGRFQSIWNFSESHLLWIQGWEKLKYILKLKLNEFVATNFRNWKKKDGWEMAIMLHTFPLPTRSVTQTWNIIASACCICGWTWTWTSSQNGLGNNLGLQKAYSTSPEPKLNSLRMWEETKGLFIIWHCEPKRKDIEWH